jgi:hypothetical protein
VMHGPEKSDSAEVARKPANKAGRPAAERVERRAGAEGNAVALHMRRTPVSAGDMAFPSPSEVIVLVNSGRLRALAVSAHERVPALPSVPTMPQAGVPGAELLGWAGLCAPARTPIDIVRKIESRSANRGQRNRRSHHHG